ATCPGDHVSSAFCMVNLAPTLTGSEGIMEGQVKSIPGLIGSEADEVHGRAGRDHRMTKRDRVLHGILVSLLLCVFGGIAGSGA
uniref:Uncharacterized protein n=2 Tax=Aegilops tauschii TaxID=37682 RepID=A0A453KSP7_AEGTS